LGRVLEEVNGTLMSLKVEVRDSDTHEVLKTFDLEHGPQDGPMFREFYVPAEDFSAIVFDEDPEGWIRALPKALAGASMIYAEVIEEEDAA
jgi:hypothetical protein